MNAKELLAGLAELAFDLRHTVPSPCVSVCRIDDASGLCQGCYRSLDEIMDWSRLDEAGKRRVWIGVCQRAGLPHRPTTEEARG
jgi:uncharacterized protein